MAKRNENRAGNKKKTFPYNWKHVPLVEVGKWVGGGTPSKSNSEYWQQAIIPWASSQDIKQIKLTKTSYSISEKAVKESTTNIIPENSIVIVVRSGILRHNLPISKTLFPVAINQDLKALIPKSQSFFTDYIIHMLSFNKKDILRTCSKVGTTVESIQFENLKKYRVLIPPLSEQKKIAKILSTWDRAIEQTHRLIEAKKRLKKGLMQQLLTGRMRFPEFGPPVKDPGETPVGWKRLRASEIFKNKSIKKHNHAHVLSVTQDQGVVLRSSLERKINMSFENTDTYKLVEPGDFVISLRSFQGGLEYSRLKGLVSPAYYVICSQKEICDDFYKHYFKSYRFIGHLAIAVIGIRDGKQISFSDFSFMKIPYPSHKEQRKIAAVLNACDLEIKQLTKQESALKKQKQGLMQKLLTGEIRVNKIS